MQGDLPAIVALQAHALRRLARSVYTTQQIEAFIGMGTMDIELIDSGRYYVVERQATLMACAGWSLDESGDGKTALVRAVYVHPDWARRGLGSLLMHHVQQKARQAGCTSIQLVATLSGVPLYRQLGYAETSVAQFPLPCGLSLSVRHMALSTEGAAGMQGGALGVESGSSCSRQDHPSIESPTRASAQLANVRPPVLSPNSTKEITHTSHGSCFRQSN